MAADQERGNWQSKLSQTEAANEAAIRKLVKDKEDKFALTASIWAILRDFNLGPDNCHYQLTEVPMGKGKSTHYEISLRPRLWDEKQARQIVQALINAGMLARLNRSNITLRPSSRNKYI